LKSTQQLNALTQLLHTTRKQQGLSREELAGLAQVSTSFIRDAEQDAAKCSFGKLTHLIDALGLTWFVK
jgi:transcriptional regulator with XRE-family HTH domain